MTFSSRRRPAIDTDGTGVNDPFELVDGFPGAPNIRLTLAAKTAAARHSRTGIPNPTIAPTAYPREWRRELRAALNRKTLEQECRRTVSRH